MSVDNQSCENSGDLKTYQHHVYAVWYSLILAPGLLGNVLALWVFRVYIKETKKAVVFMMNLAVADLLQVRFPSIFYAEKKEKFWKYTLFLLFFQNKIQNIPESYMYPEGHRFKSTSPPQQFT